MGGGAVAPITSSYREREKTIENDIGLQRCRSLFKSNGHGAGFKCDSLSLSLAISESQSRGGDAGHFPAAPPREQRVVLAADHPRRCVPRYEPSCVHASCAPFHLQLARLSGASAPVLAHHPRLPPDGAIIKE